MQNRDSLHYQVTAYNAAGDSLFVGEESTDAYDFVQVPESVAVGGAGVNATTTERLTVGTDNPKGEPVYVKTLPHTHPVHPGRTVLDVFGRDGYWFTVPGDFPASLAEEFHRERATYAVFQSTDIVPGGLVWAVHTVTGLMGRVETSLESRRAAVREALASLSRHRMQRARAVIENRAAARWRPVPAPVRVAAGDAGWVAHVHCACEDVPGAEDFPSVVRAARDWIDLDPGTPWALCPRSPGFFRSAAGIRYTIIQSGRAHVHACLYGITDDGHTGYVRLADVSEHTL